MAKQRKKGRAREATLGGEPRNESSQLRLLLRALSEAWARVNWALFGQALSAPNFRTHAPSEKLAYWDPRRRIISFNEEFLLTEPWLEVEEVLRHEMAHQYVDEELRVDESPHGPAFQALCQRLAIDGAARRKAKPEDARVSRLQQRLKKLFALAKSENQHEAEQAMVRAQALQEALIQEGFDGSDADERAGFSWRQLDEGRLRREGFEYAIGSLLSEFFSVRVIWCPVYDREGARWVSTPEISGRPAHLEVAEHVYHFLQRSARELWRRHLRAHPGIGRQRAAFLRGVIIGFRGRLEAQREETERAHAHRQRSVKQDSTEALTLRTQQLQRIMEEEAREDYVSRRHPRLRSTRGSRVNRLGEAEGIEAGAKIQLHDAVHGETGGGRLLTGPKR